MASLEERGPRRNGRDTLGSFLAMDRRRGISARLKGSPCLERGLAGLVPVPSLVIADSEGDVFETGLSADGPGMETLWSGDV